MEQGSNGPHLPANLLPKSLHLLPLIGSMPLEDPKPTSTKYQTQELNWLALHLQHNFASRRGRDQRRMLAGISSTRYSSTEVQLTLRDPLSSSKAWGCTRTLSSARCLLTKPERPESRTQNQRKADAPSQQVAGLAAAL